MKMQRAIHFQLSFLSREKREAMPTTSSNPLSCLIASTAMSNEYKCHFNPWTYQFNLSELQPAIGQPFSYFTQASWTIASTSLLHQLGSKTIDIPVQASSTELIPNERTNERLQLNDNDG
jgi:hypothetical protein